MADIFIPKIIHQLTDNALEKIQERVNLVVGAEEEVKKLSKRLKILENVLYDAEGRRLEDDGVRVWLDMLDDIAYDMQDVLEEWNIKIVKTKGAEPEPEPEPEPIQKHTLLEKVRMFIQSFCSCLKQVPLRSEFGSRIKEINDELDSILTQAQQFSFRITRTTPFSAFKHTITLPNVDETKVHGRENDKKILLQHLLFDRSQKSIDQEVVQDNRFKVISVVGLGGSGKTTLAQFLYNDERVREHFNLKKWICVSDPFDEIRIAQSLVESSGNDHGSLLEPEKDCFSKKRFLLVLDDVWTEDRSKWEQILLLLKDCAHGSVILVTTRSERVARTIGTHYLHKLGFLENSDCWLIIKQIALSERSELCPRVEEIGQAIANKCKGLPLAAKTLGGVLLFKDTVREWRDIQDSNIWQMEKAAMGLFPHFYLSYKELSPAMKRCFSFCAIYPKDHEIETDSLIKMWMAQGYLGGGERMEMEGAEVVKSLAVRSFFQESEESDDGVIYCVKMHDLVHDFAQFLVKGECQAFVEGETNQGNVESERRPCRHVMVAGQAKSIHDFLVFDIGNLRTLCLNYDNHSEFAPNLCSRLKSVRALMLGYLSLEDFPREIGALIHLRCLDVSENYFRELPETLCDLHYLETLNISLCLNLRQLPERFGDLGRLRHLLNVHSCGLKQTQHGIENLTSLRVVKQMVLRADGASLDFLAKLIHLEELGVSLKEWNDLESVDVALLELVEHVSRIRELTISDCEKLPFPKGMVSKLANSSITHLHIVDCRMISPLPVLGKLPSLQHLFLSLLPGIEHIGKEFYGLSTVNVQCEDINVAFPLLKILNVNRLEDWRTWEDISEEDNNISVMPLLEKLSIEHCYRLESLPHQILEKASHLKELYIHACTRLKIEESWMRTKLTNDFKQKIQRNIKYKTSTNIKRKIMKHQTALP